MDRSFTRREYHLVARLLLPYINHIPWLSLTHDAQQLNRFLDECLMIARTHVNLLSQRSLSIAGCGLVANSLIRSRIWHCSRTLPVSLSFLRCFHSIIGQLINNRSIPRISFKSLARPRSEGGMAILDPVFQHSALPRWLLPLLGFDSSASKSFALLILAHVLRTACDTPTVFNPSSLPGPAYICS
ncbi:hypothetical protein VTP01DRAFT_7457 [Rhizomucor pusillus]|uniref:uncharacterized protein n=1 Tax=Rhizomucor pusillus TaxID=4840 RepID=UPI0037426BDC